MSVNKPNDHKNCFEILFSTFIILYTSTRYNILWIFAIERHILFDIWRNNYYETINAFVPYQHTSE